MAQTPFTNRRWTRKEYERLVEIGVFEDEPLELIGGEVFVAEPKCVLETYRDPMDDTSAVYGWRYGSVTTLAPPSSASPLAFPSIQIAGERSPAVSIAPSVGWR